MFASHYTDPLGLKIKIANMYDPKFGYSYLFLFDVCLNVSNLSSTWVYMTEWKLFYNHTVDFIYHLPLI